jgi:hypothetical protein
MVAVKNQSTLIFAFSLSSGYLLLNNIERRYAMNKKNDFTAIQCGERVLSLIQPWGSLISFNEKLIETRPWSTQYRGRLYIHAGKKIERRLVPAEVFMEALARHGIQELNQLPTGLILARCNLVDCLKVIEVRRGEAKLENGQTVSGNEFQFGYYAPGRYAWILSDIEMLEHRIPAKGQLGIWKYNQ